MSDFLHSTQQENKLQTYSSNYETKKTNFSDQHWSGLEDCLKFDNCGVVVFPYFMVRHGEN